MQKTDDREEEAPDDGIELIVYDDGKIRPRDYQPPRRKRSEETLIGHKKVH